MGKIYNSLSGEIMAAMKAGEKKKVNALKNLKAKMLEFKTSVEGAKIVNANNGEIPDSNEITVIKKYVKELQGDVELYATAKPEAAKEAEEEMKYLEVYLPRAASADDINVAIMKYIAENGDFDQKKMGIVVKYVKEALPSAEGGLVAAQIKAYLNPKS